MSLRAKGMKKKFRAPAAPVITWALLKLPGTKLYQNQTESQAVKCKELKSKSVKN
jgi:hypothetical protein